VGWERNAVRNSARRWEHETRAKVAILGSSTSKDWLPGAHLAKRLGLPNGSVVDAHINGCHQGCTWAEVQRMLQRHAGKRCRWKGEDRCSPPKSKRFQKVFFGTNLFQICENTHSKRSLQHSILTPTEDVPALMAIYLEAESPLLYVGRFIGTKISHGYGDTRALRDYWGQKWLGKARRGHAHAWYRQDRPPKESAPLTCAYGPEQVALKRRFSAAMLDDLRALTEHVYIMLLPDRSVALDEAEHRRRWAAHLALHRDLAESRDWVTIIDLVTDGVKTTRDFKDGFHLRKRGVKRQLALFDRRLEALGLTPSSGEAK
jgi:hypothetical protein